MADKEEIRERSDIVDIVGAAVALKKRGRAFLGLCPFHTEKTPSFNVNPDLQTFKCFGCGEGGDVFRFVERYQNMSFPEAAEFLARRAGLAFERHGGRAGGEDSSARDRLTAVNAVAAAYFQNMLLRVNVAQVYLQQRGLKNEVTRQFKVGYAPNSWDSLVGHLRAHRQDMKAAAGAGLVKENSNGEYFDVFRHRIIFPIQDEQERIVGFGGRSLGDEQPKYLNTGETPVFAKSKLLYGLHFARRAIAERKLTLLMEGYMDVLASHQAGFTNAVATLGTSLTDEHAKRLARLSPEGSVALVYDGDSAGIKATLRSSELLEKEGVSVLVARLPVGEDPDSMLTRGDTSAFQKVLDTAVGRVEYQLERVVEKADQSTEAGRAKMLQQIVFILGTVGSYAERDSYIEKVWQLSPSMASNPGFAKQQLHTDARASALKQQGHDPAESALTLPRQGQRGAYRKTAPPGAQSQSYRGNDGYSQSGGRTGHREGARPEPERFKSAGPPPRADGRTTAEERAERELVRALAEPEWRVFVLKQVGPDDFRSGIARRFCAFMSGHAAELGTHPGDLITALIRHEGEDYSLAIRQYLQEIGINSEKLPVNEALILGCARTLKRRRLETREKDLESEMARLLQVSHSTSDMPADEKQRVNQEILRLLRELKGSDGSTASQGE